MGLFQKGQSGNPRGRQPGSGDPLEAASKLIAPHLRQITEQTLAAALQGDTKASVACIELTAAVIAKKKARDAA